MNSTDDCWLPFLHHNIKIKINFKDQKKDTSTIATILLKKEEWKGQISIYSTFDLESTLHPSEDGFILP